MNGRRVDMGAARGALEGGLDRARTVSFSFDGRAYSGFQGDTLASALLAAGVRVVGRSFKRHRRRGVLSAGVEEPNALVGVGRGGRFEPNTRATDLFLYEGLCAESQNRWPSLDLDLGAAADLLAPFIPAGFYYKTFFGGPKAWLFYERLIRRAAGLGAAPFEGDPDGYQHRAAFCDVLVVGAGPAGLAAAAAAARSGARVMLVEQDARLGGSLLRDPASIDGLAPEGFARAVADEVRAGGGRVLTRATAAGYWDHDLITVVQRLAEPGQPPAADGLSQRLWRVRARRVVLAAGAIERPLLFEANDAPGVMLSSAVRTYVRRFSVLPGRRTVVVGCTDDMYETARALLQAGGEVAAVLDLRASASPAADRLAGRVPVHLAARPVRALCGRSGAHALVADIDGVRRTLEADVVAMSGGFTPTTHLHMQAGGSLDWLEPQGAFIPGATRQAQASAGAAAGRDGLADHLADGWRRGGEAAALSGHGRDPGPPPASGSDPGGSGLGLAYEPSPAVHAKAVFVDFQNDVTLADLDLAWREGYRSVEHMKRYTTLGMATDQGKTSNLNGLSRLAVRKGAPMPAAGLTTFRPPFTPVTLGALAGAAVGEMAAPIRRMALHALHQAAGALWQPSGYWMRPRAFPRDSETLEAAALREACAVRRSAGLTDVSTLAKFEVVGPDAAVFLERVCATSVARLGIGRGRYTFMLREDGLVFDDGTVWRLEDQRYFLTSSTGGADRMASHLSYVRHLLAPELRAAVFPVQERWSGAALAGPRAREVLEDLLEGPAPDHMSALEGRLLGTAVRILSASYSGERAFEVYASAPAMGALFAALRAGVEARGGGLYGLEALELLRIEKGHPEVGAEIDGRRSPFDLGLGRLLNPKGGYLGAAGLARPDLRAPDRAVLVGLQADGPIPEGAMLCASRDAAPEGHVSSAGRRLVEEGFFALGLLRGGGERHGEMVLARSPTRRLSCPVRVRSPHGYDPEGRRYHD